MIARRCFLLAVTAFSIGYPLIGHADDAGTAEIERLLGRVQASSCGFFRNGTRYSGHEAADHLRKKWRYATRGSAAAMTGPQFIAEVATASSMTGQPYLVDCGKGAQPLADWLSALLRESAQPP